MRWLGLFASFVACSSSLPSAEPLGAGPMADRGDAAVVATTGPGGKADGGAAVDAAPAPPPPVVADKPASDGGAEASAAAAPPAAAKDAGASGAPAALVVAGEYQGWDTTTYRVPNVPPTPQRDPNAKTRVIHSGGDAIEVVIVNSANGQDLCRLKGKLKAGNVTFDKGQRCFEEGDGMMTAALRTGTARFSGKQLIMDLEFDLTIDTGQEQMKGDVVYHFEGNRK